jgi:hypothetical protein
MAGRGGMLGQGPGTRAAIQGDHHEDRATLAVSTATPGSSLEAARESPKRLTECVGLKGRLTVASAKA